MLFRFLAGTKVSDQKQLFLAKISRNSLKMLEKWNILRYRTCMDLYNFLNKFKLCRQKDVIQPNPKPTDFGQKRLILGWKSADFSLKMLDFMKNQRFSSLYDFERWIRMITDLKIHENIFHTTTNPFYFANVSFHEKSTSFFIRLIVTHTNVD